MLRRQLRRRRGSAMEGAKSDRTGYRGKRSRHSRNWMRRKSWSSASGTPSVENYLEDAQIKEQRG